MRVDLNSFERLTTAGHLIRNGRLVQVEMDEGMSAAIHQFCRENYDDYMQKLVRKSLMDDAPDPVLVATYLTGKYKTPRALLNEYRSFGGKRITTIGGYACGRWMFALREGHSRKTNIPTSGFRSIGDQVHDRFLKYLVAPYNPALMWFEL